MKTNINSINKKNNLSDKTKQFLIKLWIIASLSWAMSCNDINTPKELQQNNKQEIYIEEKEDPTLYKQIEKAKEELAKNWIPEFQKTGYVQWKSEKAFNNITPQSYGDLLFNMKRYYRYKTNAWRDKNDLLRAVKWEKLKNESICKKNIYYNIPKRDDAFLLYLWMPQKHNSFGISDYHPKIRTEKNKIYFKLNYLTTSMKQKLLDYILREKSARKPNEDTTKFIVNERTTTFEVKIDSLIKKWIARDNPEIAEWSYDNPLWDFKVSISKDKKWNFISIYDIRDLTPFQTGKGSSITKEEVSSSLLDKLRSKWYNVNKDTEVSSLFWAGKPFEIYDKIYYNPITKKILE